MGNTLNLNQTIVFGEKEYQNFIKKYNPIKTEYEEEKNNIMELLDSADIDYNLCSDLEGLASFKITLKFPALPISLGAFDIFLPSPSLSLSCKVNNIVDFGIDIV